MTGLSKLKVIADDKTLEMLWEKEKMLVTRIFSLFHNVSYPYQSEFNVSVTFIFVVCKSFQFRPVLKNCHFGNSYGCKL